MNTISGALGVWHTASDLEIIWTIFALIGVSLGLHSVARKEVLVRALVQSGYNSVSLAIARDRLQMAWGVVVRQGCFVSLGLLVCYLPNRPINLNEYINSSEAAGLLILAAEVTDVVFMVLHELNWKYIRDRWTRMRSDGNTGTVVLSQENIDSDTVGERSDAGS